MCSAASPCAHIRPRNRAPTRFQPHGRGLIQLGLLLLIATPIARVVFSVAGFARQRDWLYVAITLIVLTLLGYSLLAGSVLLTTS